MAKCYKCGKEIHGFKESLVGLSTCPECDTLELLKQMKEEQDTRRRLDHPRSYSYEEDDKPVVFEPNDSLAPNWWKKAKDTKTSGAAAVIAILMGEWGFPFIYIGGEWTILGVGMFAVFITLMFLYPMISLAYLFFTNFLMFVWFICMDDDDFLKRFRRDLWIDKQIADQYGHKVDEFGNYTDIPLNKPSWNEAFQSNSSGASYSNVSDAGSSLRLKIQK